jgi:hypothetical protein
VPVRSLHAREHPRTDQKAARRGIGSLEFETEGGPREEAEGTDDARAERRACGCGAGKPRHGHARRRSRSRRDRLRRAVHSSGNDGYLRPRTNGGPVIGTRFDAVERCGRIDGEDDGERHRLPERSAIGSLRFDRAAAEHRGIRRANHELCEKAAARAEPDLSLDRALRTIVERLATEPVPNALGQLALAEARLGSLGTRPREAIRLVGARGARRRYRRDDERHRDQPGVSDRHRTGA